MRKILFLSCFLIAPAVQAWDCKYEKDIDQVLDLAGSEVHPNLRYPHDLALDLCRKPAVVAADQGTGDPLHRGQGATLRLADHDRHGILRH